MKKTLFCMLPALAGALVLMAAAPAATPTAAPIASKPLRIGIVNFKSIVENSKMGKHEQANFEGLKKQMESVLGEKEKTLNEMATKLNDPDYLDSLSPEAETELKRKFRAMNQEIGQQQQQYMQTLQQTNMKVIQKLSELVTKATENLAKTENLDVVLNEESSFFFAPSLDLSAKVISILDADFEKDLKSGKLDANPAANLGG